MTYTIKLPVFEGPFDLLLHLIKANEMDIHDIQLAEITKQYVEYIAIMRQLDLELAGEFLVMAATLIHIKARTLLPTPFEAEEREEEIDEIMTARELVRQLVEYRKYKEATAALRKREEQAARVFYRSNVIMIVPENTDELSIDVTLLYKAFARVLNFIESPAYRPEFKDKFTVEDKISYIEALTTRASEVDLSEVFRRCFNRSEIIVTFLAVLELCRMNRIRIRQIKQFDMIVMTDNSGQLELDVKQADAETDTAVLPSS
ncbi:MAG: segregation/condensation protein A [bacterium]|nr:segregation/condensation protein A [Candidatus Sumerlaeota bacterium]